MVSSIFDCHPYLGKIPILTNIFQRGWNHQQVVFDIYFWRDLGEEYLRQVHIELERVLYLKLQEILYLFDIGYAIFDLYLPHNVVWQSKIKRESCFCSSMFLSTMYDTSSLNVCCWYCIKWVKAWGCFTSNFTRNRKLIEMATGSRGDSCISVDTYIKSHKLHFANIY